MNGRSIGGRPTLGGFSTVGTGGSIIPFSPDVGIPDIWYDGRVLGGTDGNTGLVNNGNANARRNLGKLGSAWDQGAGLNAGQTATLPPLIKIPAQAGKVGGIPGIFGAGASWMQTSRRKFTGGGLNPLPTQNGPMTILSVFQVTDLLGSYYLYAGDVAGGETELIVNFGGAGKIQLNNGSGGFVDTGQVVVAGAWNMSIAIINGANSRHRLNGVASGLLAINAAQHFSGIMSLGSLGAAFLLKGMELFQCRWVGVQPNPTDIEALVNAWCPGGFPQ